VIGEDSYNTYQNLGENLEEDDKDSIDSVEAHESMEDMSNSYFRSYIL